MSCCLYTYNLSLKAVFTNYVESRKLIGGEAFHNHIRICIFVDSNI